jgi:hypothetical protein
MLSLLHLGLLTPESTTPINAEAPLAAPCGDATHPADSVIGLNGRNAAEAVLADAGVAIAAPA